MDPPVQKTPAIRFVDLQRQYRRYRTELLSAIEGVLERGDFILGAKVSEFERHFAFYVGCRYAVGVDSGTSALCLALEALGIGPGDDVVTVPNTFIATALAVSTVGARPVFVDVEETTQLMAARLLERVITPRTKAILPVHLFGRMADMKAILETASQRGLAVVEDACQAHGAEQDGRKAGSLGCLGCFSFYPGKNLGAYGDAGAVVTNDEALYQKLLLLRNHGSPRKYHHETKGRNARLDTIQAAVLDVKLKYLDEWNRRRREIAARYRQRLEGVKGLGLPPPDAPGSLSSQHLFVIVAPGRRDDLASFLKETGIEVVIHYPIPIHRQAAYAELKLTEGSYPVAERLAGSILSLPIHPDMTDDEADVVVAAVRRFFGGGMNCKT